MHLSESNKPSSAGQQQKPPPHTATCDSLRYDLIAEAMDLAASYARSAAEAAWRADQLTLEVHLKQLRLSVLAGIETFKLLGDAVQGGRAA
jgi:hypothetical protein